MEENKSIWKLIGWLKKIKNLDVVAFYQEVPIKGRIEISDIDEKLEQIIWKADKTLIPPLKETRHLYFKYNDEVFILTVIAYDSKEIATSFPTLALDKKLNRSYVRVKTSHENPVTVQINDLKFNADDISEAGVGIITPKKDTKELQEGAEYDLKLSIKGEELPAKGVIVYIRDAGSDFVRIGIKFTQLKPRVQDKIVKYIMDRQREIAKKIFLFKS
ncbi:flagellar brake protein [Persephonella hydrogeniphila]|uniref:flagellar brake protein n=1 Tax=Persephonella hydrogeniphila TaxID=198703 RepID=UPI0015DDF907|nr:PilZ domain-containing protein [Persephonella hydrogeniphila]